MFEMISYGACMTATLMAGAIIAGLCLLALLVAVRVRWFGITIILLACVLAIYKFKPDKAFYADHKLEMAILTPHNSGKHPAQQFVADNSIPPPKKVILPPPPTKDKQILNFASHYLSVRPTHFPIYEGISIQEGLAIDILMEYEQWLKSKGGR